MKGYIPVTIPTKKYIAAYLRKQYGKDVLIKRNSLIGNKLFDLLEHKTNHKCTEYGNGRHNTKIKIYIPIETFKRRGGFLNESNVMNFNLFLEYLVKTHFYNLMDILYDIHPAINQHLPYIRQSLGIDIEDWSDDSMRKDYYRYRLENKIKLLRNHGRLVPLHFS
jgi:hypothetical protein